MIFFLLLNLFDWSWIGNEDALYFQIDLCKELRFESIYSAEANEKGLACSLSCKTKAGFCLSNQDNYLFKNLQIHVQVDNTSYPKEVFYTIQTFASYFNEKTRQVIIEDDFFQDILLNPTVDVEELPLFFSFIDDEGSGVIVFKNLFHSD